MSNPFIGEIRMGGWNYAPSGWAMCNGASLAVSQNETLYQLLGTTYGGDGVNTFNLPNMQGRLPVHMSGQLPLGAAGGSESVTLTVAQMPTHTHSIIAGTAATSQNPAGLAPAVTSNGNPIYNAPGNPVAMAPLIGPYGGSQPHENRMPYLAVTFVISLFGIFPSRN